MSKPLELTIYPPAEKEPLPSDSDWLGWDDWRAWNRANTYEFHKRQGKRLTEAELCAEYEAARCDAMVVLNTGRCWSSPYHSWPMDKRSILNRASTLLRFALAPHYFEATEPESDTK